MKKVFALVLAAAMVLSMASVAFAANKEIFSLNVVSDLLLKVEDHEQSVVNDENVLVYGDTVYIIVESLLFEVNDTIETLSREATLDEIIKNYKLKADWSKNEDLIESVSFKKIIVDNMGGDKDNLSYVIAIETKEMPEAVDAEDVIGTIELETKSKNTILDSARYMGNEYKFDVAFTLNVKDAEINKTENDDLVYNFKGSEDEEHEIELYAGMGMFVVNTYGQDKLVINTDVDYNEGIENVAPDANYVYFNSNNATFNRLGDLYLYADENDIVYKVNKDGSLVKLTPKYDEDEEAFVLRTRVIGSYVIAEEELSDAALVAGVEKEEAPAAPVAPSVPTNPSTGAAC